MNILVLIKPVPDPEKYSELRIDPQTKRLVREGVPTVVDPAGRNALEAALVIMENIKKSGGSGTITVLSMAPDFSRDKIVECLAMGADEGYMLSDKAYGGADTYATSYVLAEGIKYIARAKAAGGGAAVSATDGETAGGEAGCGAIGGFDLILAGNESADGATSHVPAQVAEWLGIPSMCNVDRIEIDTADASGVDPATAAHSVRVRKRTEELLLEFEGTLPAVIAVNRAINKPRFINAMGIIKARKKPLTILSNDDLGLDPSRIGLEGSPTKPGELITPNLSRASRPLTDTDGTATDAAQAILSLVRKAGD